MRVSITKQMFVSREWAKLNKTKQHMEELILNLMSHPDATAEDLIQAHTAYSNVCTLLDEAKPRVENVIGRTPQAQIMDRFNNKGESR